MEKLTDAEVVKALDNCLRGDCSWCVRKRQGVGLVTCRKEMRKYALDLINRQKAEIEGLEKARQKQAQFLGEERGQKYELINKIAKAKFEAYKEFADRLKNKATLKTRVEMHPSPYLGVKPVLQKPEYVIECESFDNILKELTEE